MAFVVTSEPERSAQARADLPEATVVAAADDLWERAGELDLVVVAASNRAHAPLAEASLRAGVPVVVDKPLATTVADARRLSELAAETGLMLAVFHNRRWDDDFRTLCRLVTRRALGPVVRLESRFERYRPEVAAERWRESPDAGGRRRAAVRPGQPSDRPGAACCSATPRACTRRSSAAPWRSGGRRHLRGAAFRGRAESRTCGRARSPRGPGPGSGWLGLEGAFESWGLDPQEDALKSGLRPGDAGWGERPEEAWPRLAAGHGRSGGPWLRCPARTSCSTRA